MHLARIIGSVWSTQKVESLKGQRLLIVQPVGHDGKPNGRPLVAVDTVSAAPGQLVYFVKSREAAKALSEKFNPADAAILGIVDEVRTYAGDG
ncbi:MAG: ethanolamine utilization protein EutN [Candidatus Eisenbacteria bacterium]|nr:ethanolamine utilization protein EutN [Candidatus Eisenbacteria bacterium]